MTDNRATIIAELRRVAGIFYKTDPRAISAQALLCAADGISGEWPLSLAGSVERLFEEMHFDPAMDLESRAPLSLIRKIQVYEQLGRSPAIRTTSRWESSIRRLLLLQEFCNSHRAEKILSRVSRLVSVKDLGEQRDAAALFLRRAQTFVELHGPLLDGFANPEAKTFQKALQSVT